ncbi:MAG: hypothetical protein D1H97_20275, partial [Paracoccus sp. BP8]
LEDLESPFRPVAKAKPLITKIRPNTLGQVLVDGVPRVPNVATPNGFTINNQTGQITFVTAPGLGQAIDITYLEFYVHVRFDVDFMDVQLVTYRAETWADIFLVEIKEDVQGL